MVSKSGNRGFNFAKELSEQSNEDWKLGATGLTCLAEIPEEEREKYLPKGERQFGKEDFMSCVSIGILNILASKFTYLIDKRKLSLGNHAWLLEKGYIKDGKVDFSVRFPQAGARTKTCLRLGFAHSRSCRFCVPRLLNQPRSYGMA